MNQSSGRGGVFVFQSWRALEPFILERQIFDGKGLSGKHNKHHGGRVTKSWLYIGDEGDILYYILYTQNMGIQKRL